MYTLCDFSNHLCRAKDIFEIIEITKPIAYSFIRQYHYLADAKFFSIHCFGLYNKHNGKLCGCATYSLPQGRYTSYGWFGLPANSRDVLELTRLCVLPELNGTNATSFLLSNSIKMLKKYGVRAIITLADATRHVGSIYQICNFKYYGLCADKDYFYALDGRIMPRGSLHNVAGVWLRKPPKHRYAFILDKSLKCKYGEKVPPKSSEILNIACCNDKYVVEDKRYHKYYTCPKCTKKMIEIDYNTYNYIIDLNDNVLDYVNSIINKNCETNAVIDNKKKVELF